MKDLNIRRLLFNITHPDNSIAKFSAHQPSSGDGKSGINHIFPHFFKTMVVPKSDELLAAAYRHTPPKEVTGIRVGGSPS